MTSPRRGLVPHERFGLRLTLIGVGALVVAVPFTALVLLVRTKWGPLHSFDVSTAADLNRFLAAHPAQVDRWKLVSTIGGPSAFRGVCGVAALVLWCMRRRRSAVFVVVTMIGAAVLSATLKSLVDRARPVLAVPVDRAPGASFPSGHALTSLVGAGVLLIVLVPYLNNGWRTFIGTVSIAIVLAVGFSRVILGVHFASDVLGGWIVGGAWLLGAIGAFHDPAVAAGGSRVNRIPV